MRFRLLLFLLFPITLNAQAAASYKFSMLSTFNNNSKDPYSPTSFVIDSGGNLYGTSAYGGKFSSGTLFEVTSKGVLSTLYSFNPNANENGYGPGSGAVNPTTLARDSKGNLYGSTPTICCGEDNSAEFPGDIFELKSGKKTLTNLYSDGASPTELALDSAGNIFGMDCGSSFFGLGCGPAELYEIPAGGGYTVLYSWGLDADDNGISETGNLVLRNGSVYGTEGGTQDGIISPYGEIWEWSPQSGISVVHDFDGTDGQYPSALRQDAAGNLYGATLFGGNSFGYGTVFKITATGAFSTLYNFCSRSNCTDGFSPENITLDSAGNIYGIAVGGGSNNDGVFFKLTPSGTETVLYNFTSIPASGLVMDKSGNFYGTMSNGNGGLNGVWKLTKQ